jgi:DNA-binding response OmpR family regulator
MNPDSADAALRPRVLILEDEAQVANLLELGLREWFREPAVKCFANGNDVWAEIGREEPDLLIMDWAHPGMDGSELMAKLTAKPVHFVILLTSDLFSTEVETLAKKGIKVAYLPKPFGIRQYWKALNQFLGPSDFPENQARLAGLGLD